MATNNPVDPGFFERAKPNDLELASFMEATLKARQLAQQQPQLADIQISPYSKPVDQAARMQQEVLSQQAQRMSEARFAREQEVATPQQREPASSEPKTSDIKNVYEMNKDIAYNKAAALGDTKAMYAIDADRALKHDTEAFKNVQGQQSYQKTNLDMLKAINELQQAPGKAAAEQRKAKYDNPFNKEAAEGAGKEYTALSEQANTASQIEAASKQILPLLDPEVVKTGVFGDIRQWGRTAVPGLENEAAAGTLINQYGMTDLIQKAQGFKGNFSEKDRESLMKVTANVNNTPLQNKVYATLNLIGAQRMQAQKKFLDDFMDIKGDKNENTYSEAKQAWKKFVDVHEISLDPNDLQNSLKRIYNGQVNLNDTSGYLNQLRQNGGDYKAIKLLSRQDEAKEQLKQTQFQAQMKEQQRSALLNKYPQFADRVAAEQKAETDASVFGGGTSQ